MPLGIAWKTLKDSVGVGNFIFHAKGLLVSAENYTDLTEIYIRGENGRDIYNTKVVFNTQVENVRSSLLVQTLIND